MTQYAAVLGHPLAGQSQEHNSLLFSAHVLCTRADLRPPSALPGAARDRRTAPGFSVLLVCVFEESHQTPIGIEVSGRLAPWRCPW